MRRVLEGDPPGLGATRILGRPGMSRAAASRPCRPSLLPSIPSATGLFSSSQVQWTPSPAAKRPRPRQTRQTQPFSPPLHHRRTGRMNSLCQGLPQGFSRRSLEKAKQLPSGLVERIGDKSLVGARMIVPGGRHRESCERITIRLIWSVQIPPQDNPPRTRGIGHLQPCPTACHSACPFYRRCVRRVSHHIDRPSRAPTRLATGRIGRRPCLRIVERCPNHRRR